MAYDKVFMTMRVLDAYNRTKGKRVDLVKVDPTLIGADVDTIRNAYQGGMDGHILSTIVSGENFYAGSALPGANIDTGVTITAQLSGRPQKATLKYPTPKAVTINPDGTVDLGSVLVQAIRNLYMTTGPAIATLSDGETIDGFISGRLDK